MKLCYYLLFTFLVIKYIEYGQSRAVQRLCPTISSSNQYQQRKLIIATCETRTNEKELVDLRLWNISSRHLREQGIEMINPCRGANWKELGFIIKPMYYLQMLRSYKQQSGLDTSQLHFLLTDSDTFWSAKNIEHIWRNYDCARMGKSLVISSEMSCWVGKLCNKHDIHRWYSDSSRFLTVSPFLNSGVIMGHIDMLIPMFDYIVQHNDSYYITRGKRKLYFEDQYATTDYAWNIAPQTITLDYHQYLSASLFIPKPEPLQDYSKRDFKMQYVCIDRNKTISYHCHNYEEILFQVEHFTLDEHCRPIRVVTDQMPLREELLGFASDPIIWHSNGVNKKLYREFFHRAVKCARDRQHLLRHDPNN